MSGRSLWAMVPSASCARKGAALQRHELHLFQGRRPLTKTIHELSPTYLVVELDIHTQDEAVELSERHLEYRKRKKKRPCA